MSLFFAERATASLELDAILARLDIGFTKYAGNPVLPKGTSGQWDDFGVRDFRPVIDEDGLVVEEVDGIWAYFGGRGDSAGAMDIGLAKSTDNGVTWTRYGSNPVLTNSGFGWYQNWIAQPSVVKLDDTSRLMMAQGHDGSTVSSVGCLSSADGLTWADEGQKLTLTDFDVSGTTLSQMGVPSLIKRAAGDWLCLVEGLTSGGAPQWYVFGATASDPTATWTALNSGNPLLSPVGGSGWDGYGVANAQIIEANPGTYVVAYNGMDFATQTWEIGFAYGTDLTSLTRYSGNPVVTPTEAWEGSHLETSALLKEPSAGVLRLYYQGNSPVTGAQEIGLAMA